MKLIPLSSGFFTAVDDADYEAMMVHGEWHYSTGYAMRDRKGLGRRACELMHRLIIKPDSGMTVDHCSMNGLDNRRSNLRVATKGQNMRNRAAQKNNKS